MRCLQATRGTPLTSTERTGRIALVLAVAVGVVLIDQIAKAVAVALLEDRDPIVVIDGWLQLKVLRNFGAAFSFGSGMTWVFTGIALVVTVVVIRTSRTLVSNWWALALGALLGGALGNLIDRLVRAPGGGRGGVVDYFDVPWFSVFNIADISLTFAAIGIALLAILGVPMTAADRDERAERSADGPDTATDGDHDILKP